MKPSVKYNSCSDHIYYNVIIDLFICLQRQDGAGISEKDKIQSKPKRRWDFSDDDYIVDVDDR